jgi:1-phosphatidylinositol phosphodiesterase
MTVKNNTGKVLKLVRVHTISGKFVKNADPPNEINLLGSWECSTKSGAAVGPEGTVTYKAADDSFVVEFYYHHPYGHEASVYKVAPNPMDAIGHSVEGSTSGHVQDITFVLKAQKEFETETWMGLLDGNTTLNNVIMPGSHDAGMSSLINCDVGAGFNKGMVKTQELSVFGQLKAGSRYFDIRVDYDHNRLYTYHRTGDSGCNGQTLEEVMNDATNFIETYPSETFILKFSHIRTNRGKAADIKGKIEKMVSEEKYKKFLFTDSNKLVNLAKVPLQLLRGKIVLVFDYSGYINEKDGRFRYHDGFAVDDSETKVTHFDGYQPNLTVCDCYSGTTNFSKMEEDQLDKLKMYGGWGKEYLYLLSWTLTPGFGTFFGGSIELLAAEANSALPDALQNKIMVPGMPAPNIVYIDYVNANTCRKIIEYNFRKK